MGAWPATAPQWQAFETELANVAGTARSLDEVLTWLAGFAGAGPVELAPSRLKSNPPQRWITVGARSTDGRAAGLNVRIAELPGGGFRLLELGRGPPPGP